MTCNYCKEKMVVTHGILERNGDHYHELRWHACNNPSCPNYALLQVPQEMMPKPEKSFTDAGKARAFKEAYVEEMCKEQYHKPSKVRREKKDVVILGGEANCKHEWTLIARELSGKSVSYEQCKKCRGVLYKNGNILVEG